MRTKNHEDDLSGISGKVERVSASTLEVMPPGPLPSAKLSKQEAERFAECEHTIEGVRQSVYLAGLALITIRDERLYRENHSTFEDYVCKRWKRSRGRAYQMIDQAEISRRLSNMLDTTIILNHRQTQLLKPFSDDEKATLWEQARANSADGEVSARQLKVVVSEYRNASNAANSVTAESDVVPVAGGGTFDADQASKALESMLAKELRRWPEEHHNTLLELLAEMILAWDDGQRSEPGRA